jgi:ActR/RegA family two-component response regulator
MKEKILWVDDDPNILEAYQRKLAKVVRVDTAEGGTQGLRCVMETGPYAVVVADMQMPSMNGIEFLSRVKEIAPDTVRIMLTGNTDLRMVMQAVNTGSIMRFLSKPCASDVIGEALVAGINQYRLVTAEKGPLEETLNGSIGLLIEVLSWADPEGFGKALELRRRVRAIGRALRADNLWEMELAAMFSQVGLLLLPKDTLEKIRHRETRGCNPLSADEVGGMSLSDAERSALVKIPEIGQELLAQIPRLASVARIVLYQTKNFDGAGFPEDSVAKKNIPLGARILKVLLDLRSYEAQGLSPKAALALMQSATGTYDGRVLDAAIGLHLHVERSVQISAESSFVGPISALKAGDVVVDGIRTRDDTLLAGPGCEVTSALLVRLKFFSVLDGVQEPIKIRRAKEQ